MVFYCRVCQERRDRGKGEGEGGEGEGGEGVVATWRYAVNKFMREAFMKVSSVCACVRACVRVCVRVRVVLVDEVSCTINNTYSHYFCAQVHVHVCVCIHACMYMYEHKHTLHVYMYACTNQNKNVHVHIYMYTCTCTCRHEHKLCLYTQLCTSVFPLSGVCWVQVSFLSSVASVLVVHVV